MQQKEAVVDNSDDDYSKADNNEASAVDGDSVLEITAMDI